MRPFFMRLALVSLAAGVAYAAEVASSADERARKAAPSAPEEVTVGSLGAGLIKPPAPPRHATRKLDSASELAFDLQQVVTYLEYGQAFYRAYGKGTHSVEENQRFLKFLETYEAELALAKKEADTLRKWVYERGSLESAAP